MKVTTQSFGDLVKRRRKELRLTQGDLALVSGTGVRFISDLENGKATCALGKALDVLANLGVEITFTPKSGG
jgi:y4mF family transcriptional regulator